MERCDEWHGWFTCVDGRAGRGGCGADRALDGRRDHAAPGAAAGAGVLQRTGFERGVAGGLSVADVLHGDDAGGPRDVPLRAVACGDDADGASGPVVAAAAAVL